MAADAIKKGADAIADTFRDAFKFFSGEKETDKNAMTLDNVKLWLEQANILDHNNVKKEDVEAAFEKVSKSKETISYDEFELFLEQLATDLQMDVKEWREQLESVKGPDPT